MAKLIEAISANDLWLEAKNLIETEGENVESRSGGTKEILHILFELSNPLDKWVYKRVPPISIGFALAEIMWIVNGSQDARIIDFWNPGLKNFAADKAKSFYHGAYGYRLRTEHGIDQLERAYHALRNNPNNRQAVMLIWKPLLDIPNEWGLSQSNDIPCNICSLLKIRDGKLDWSQIIRSNDLVLGVPYNIVQFTSLQEIMAGWLGLKVGSYNQYSDSLHVYDKYEFINEIGYLSEVETIKSTDSFSISKNDFDVLSKGIFNRMKSMVDLTNPNESEYRQLAVLDSGFEAYDNILFMIAAYAARKHNLLSLTRELIKKCSNPIYKMIWHQWIDYLNTKE